MDSKVKAALFSIVAITLVVGMGVVFLGEEDDGPPVISRGSATAGPSATGGGSPSTGGPTPHGPGLRPKNGTGATIASSGGGATGGGSTSPPAGHDRRPGGAVGNEVGGARTAVEVRCTDGDGAPLPGVRIESKRGSGAPLSAVVSDSSGVARIPDLTVGERISGAGRSATSAQPAHFGPVKVSARTVIQLKFTASALGLLEGTLFDDGGNPIQPEDEPTLLLLNPKSPDGEATLDAAAMNLRGDGTFQAHVATGAYSVLARAKGRSDSDRSYVTVTERDPARLNLVLRRSGSIGGTITLPSGMATPVALEIVAEIKSGSAENPHTRTKRYPVTVDGSGRFLLEGCDAGRWRMRVEDPSSGGRLVGPWHVLRLESGKNVTGYSMKLSEVMVSVRGTVRNDQGLPMEGAQVSVGSRRATTGQDGTYELRGLDIGRTDVEVTFPGHGPTVEELVYRGAQVQRDLVLERYGGVRGVVTREGKPAAFVDVGVCFQEEDGVRPYETKTDGQGRYQLEELPPGTYFLKAGPGADYFEAEGAPTASIQPGRVVDAPGIIAE